MKVKFFSCHHIRNYDYFEAKIDKDLIILVGNNGQGKTTLLECIYVAALSKSFRCYQDAEMISFDSSEAMIDVRFEKANKVNHQIEIKIKKDKEIYFNKTKINRRADLVGKLLVVIFTPDDLLMFKSGASVRRNFLNIELSKLDAVYIKEANITNKLIKKRNLVLKEYPLDEVMLQVITEQLIESQLQIIAKRKRYIDSLSVYVAKYYQQLTKHTNECLELVYVPFMADAEVSGQSMHVMYENSLARDLKFKQTHHSINKDDMVATINGYSVNKYASQGQIRSVALALKLATIQIIHETCSEYPILLLDDVLSEFDDERIIHLMALLDENIQTFITTTTLNDFSSSLIANAQVLAIDNTLKIIQGGNLNGKTTL